MKRLILFAAALGLLAVGTSAGAGELEEFENYHPPALYTAYAAKGLEEALDRAGGERLNRPVPAGRRLENGGHPYGASSAFYRPDPETIRALKEVSRDRQLAGAQLASEFTLEELRGLIYLRNPGIKAAESRFRASIENFSQVEGLDVILARYSAFTEALMNGVGPMKTGRSAGIFPYPALTALQGGVVEQEVGIKFQELEIARRSALTEAARAYWKLLYNQQAREVTSTVLDLLARLESVATRRYESGKASFQDVIKVRIRKEKMAEELVTLGRVRDNLAARIIELADLAPEQVIAAPAEAAPKAEIPGVAELRQCAEQYNQEIIKARLKVGKMEKMIELAEIMILPQFTLDLSRFTDRPVLQAGSGAGQESFALTTGADMGAGLPKEAWFGVNDGYLNKTRQVLIAARHELVRIRAAVSRRVQGAWFELDRAARERDLYESKIVGLSRSALEVAGRGYESGGVGFAEVINAYSDWLNDSLASRKKLAELGIARARLAEAVGYSY